MFTRMLIGLGLLMTLHPSIGIGQEVMKLPDEIRNQMNFVVGDWTFNAKENDKSTTGFYSARWASEGTCLKLTFRSDTHNSTGLGSWDPVSNELVETWTGPATGRLELRFSMKTESVWEGISTVWGIDGKESKGKIRFEKTGPDSFRYTETTGDKTWDIENKRIVRAPGDSNPHAKELDAFVGHWEMPTEGDSKRVWVFNWNPGMNFLNNYMVNLDSGGEVKWSLNGAIGWDSGIQKITNWCISDSGQPMKFVWTKIGDTTWEAVNESGDKTWEFTPMGDRLRVVTNGTEAFYERQ